MCASRLSAMAYRGMETWQQNHIRLLLLKILNEHLKWTNHCSTSQWKLFRTIKGPRWDIFQLVLFIRLAQIFVDKQHISSGTIDYTRRYFLTKLTYLKNFDSKWVRDICQINLWQVLKTIKISSNMETWNVSIENHKLFTLWMLLSGMMFNRRN